MDLFPDSFVVGAKQGGSSGLEEIDVAIAIDIGKPSAAGAGHGQRKGIVKRKVMLYTTRNDPLRLFGKTPRTIALPLKVFKDSGHVFPADSAYRLLNKRRDARVNIVCIGPFRDAICRRRHVNVG